MTTRKAREITDTAFFKLERAGEQQRGGTEIPEAGDPPWEPPAPPTQGPCDGWEPENPPVVEAEPATPTPGVGETSRQDWRAEGMAGFTSFGGH